MAAGSKRRALTFNFPYDYMFLILKCRGESDLGLCMSSGRVKRMPLRGADFRRILRPNSFYNRKLALRSGIFFANPDLMHRPRSDSHLHFDIRNIWLIRTHVPISLLMGMYVLLMYTDDVSRLH